MAEAKYGDAGIDLMDQQLQRDWEASKEHTMPWTTAKAAVKDAYDRTVQIRRARDVPEVCDETCWKIDRLHSERLVGRPAGNPGPVNSPGRGGTFVFLTSLDARPRRSPGIAPSRFTCGVKGIRHRPIANESMRAAASSLILSRCLIFSPLRDNLRWGCFHIP